VIQSWTKGIPVLPQDESTLVTTYSLITTFSESMYKEPKYTQQRTMKVNKGPSK